MMSCKSSWNVQAHAILRNSMKASADYKNLQQLLQCIITQLTRRVRVTDLLNQLLQACLALWTR